jgi:hypothetical protein
MEHTWGTPAMNRFYQHTQMCAPQTPWHRVLLEKLTVPQLAKKFLTFSGSRKFISTFTRACQLPICGGAHYYSLYLPSLLRHLSQQKSSVSGLSKEVCIKCTEPVDHPCCRLLCEGLIFLFRGEKINTAARCWMN